MRDLRKLPRAERDLREIWRYSSKTWSARQADAYLRKLNQALHALARDPQAGSSAEELGSGLFRVLVGRHRIFYRSDEEAIVVVRVLHERMDFSLHLNEA